MKKTILLSLSGLTSSNVDEFYRVKFSRWLFENSDNVWVDGELIDEEEKQAFKFAFYNVRPKPKEIKTDRLWKGFELKESVFIKRELFKYKNIQPEKCNLSSNLKLETYIHFLQNRLINAAKVKIKQTDSLKSQQTFALYCYYAGINPRDYSREELNNLLIECGVKPSKENTKDPYHKLKQEYNKYNLYISNRIYYSTPKESQERLKRFEMILDYCKNKGLTDLIPNLEKDKNILNENINKALEEQKKKESTDL